MKYKKIILCIVMLIFLCACTHNIEIQFDRYNGYKYYIESNDNEYSSLVVRIDPTHEDVVSSIYINDINVSKGKINETIVDELEKNYNTDSSKIEEKRVSYLYTENKDGYYERIIINFYIEDNKMNLDLIEEYLGLDDLLDDNILLYENELLKCDYFKYQWIINQGNKESLELK